MMFIFSTRRSLLASSLVGLMVAIAAPLLATDRQTPGQYALTVTTDGHSRESTLCVTSDDAKAVNADAKTGREYAEKASKGACSVAAYEVNGDTIAMTLTCGEATRATKTTYHGETFEGDTTYTINADGKRVVRVSHIKARRLGVCK